MPALTPEIRNPWDNPRMVTASRVVAVLIASGFLLLLSFGCRGPEPSGDTRLTLPSGWKWEAALENQTHLTHPIGVGISSEGVVPNVNVLTNQWDGPVDPWIDKNIEFIEHTFTTDTNFPTKVVSREGFTTNQGLDGTRVVLKNQRFQKTLWHVQYYFHTNDMMQVLSFTYPKGDGPTAKSLTDKTAKTFRHYE